VRVRALFRIVPSVLSPYFISPKSEIGNVVLYGYYMDMKLDVKEIFGRVNILLKNGSI
jgi:hypothetical protein